MASPVSLEQVKAHMRLEPDETGEDFYLQALIAAATQGCLGKIGRILPDLSPGESDALGQAVRLLVGTWYRNRESVGDAASAELPQTITFLLEPMRLVAPPAPPA